MSQPAGAVPSALTPWVQFAAPATAAHMPLVCFHHAGGGATFFRAWVPTLADRGIEVWPIQLPGRENRFSEPLQHDLGALITALTGAIAGHLADRPYALYGHSVGAYVACAFAMRLAGLGLAPPRHVFVAAGRPPDHPDPDFPIHRMPTTALVAKLRSYGGMHPDVLATPELLDLVVTIARADLRLAETASWPAGAWLDCPVTAVGGRADHAVPTELLPFWRRVTGGPFEHAVIPGGHFPTPAGLHRVLDVIGDALNQ